MIIIKIIYSLFGSTQPPKEFIIYPSSHSVQAYIFFKLLHLIQFLYAVSTQPKTSLAQYFIRYPSKSILFLHFTHIPFILSSQFATSIQYPSSLI